MIQTKPCSKALKTPQDALIFLAKECDSMMGKEAQLGGWSRCWADTQLVEQRKTHGGFYTSR